MSRFRPELTLEQYRERARLLQVSVAEVAWSLVVSPAPSDQPRRWRPLTPDESAEVFDRLMVACSKFGSVDRNVRIVPPVAPARARAAIAALERRKG